MANERYKLGKMDLQASWFPFVVCFPVGVCLWAWLLVANGFVRNVAEMPWEFRIAVGVTGAKRDEDQSVALSGRFDGVWGPLFLLAFVNFIPFVLLVRPYGPVSWVSAVAYFVAHLCWLARIRRVVRRIGRAQ